MKILKRSSLDELAKKMPVIERKEQSECIGKAWGFGFNGELLGKVGSDGNIVVLTEESFSGQTSSSTWEVYYLNNNGAISFKFWDYGSGGLVGMLPSQLGASGEAVRTGIVNSLLHGRTIEYYNSSGQLCQVYINQCIPDISGGSYGFLMSPTPNGGGDAYDLYFNPNYQGHAYDNEHSLVNAIKTLLEYQ